MNDLTRILASVDPPVESAARVAVLIDGDNVPAAEWSEIKAQAWAMGNPVVRRVFADLGLHKDWLTAEDCIAVHCPSASRRNHADMCLTIMALDIAYRGLAQRFLIVSDDRDFQPVITHLREMGLAAERRGKAKPAPALPPRRGLSPLDETLHRHLEANAGKPLLLKEVGVRMSGPGKTVRGLTGCKTWRAYLTGRPDLYRVEGTGAEGAVCLVTPGARSAP